MADKFMDTRNLPFCKGCSHHLVARNINKALESLDIDPLDVIVVTDIGCHGIIDRRFSTHTVHGLHGRSVALASGIAMALNNPDKKVVVFIGDGGATIGMNHLVAAAHRNFDMTVVVHNNMLYGMTGGQQSDLTPGAFKNPATMGGFTDSFLDIPKMVKNAGAAYVSRIVAMGDFSDQLADAMKIPGFSLMEILEICPSYGTKYNPDLNIKNLVEKLSFTLEEYRNDNIKKAKVDLRDNLESLFEPLVPVETKYEHSLEKPTSILIGGSAGEGVQVAANIFANAAMMCGLNVTIKSNYPVTVGVGYSAVEIIISPNEIEFTGLRDVDFALISSGDGMSFLRGKLERMTVKNIIADSGLSVDIPAEVIQSGDFRKKVKGRESNLLMLMVLLLKHEIFPFDAIIEAVSNHRISERLDIAKLVGISENVSAGIES